MKSMVTLWESVKIIAVVFVMFVNFISIYAKTPNEHLVSGVTGQRTISLQKVNLPDTGKHI